jgi:hypothetical protein
LKDDSFTFAFLFDLSSVPFAERQSQKKFVGKKNEIQKHHRQNHRNYVSCNNGLGFQQ